MNLIVIYKQKKIAKDKKKMRKIKKRHENNVCLRRKISKLNSKKAKKFKINSNKKKNSNQIIIN